MKYGTIPGVEKQVSRIAQGAVMLGSGEKADNFKLLDAVYENGINLFDSAHVYAGGACDRVLGEWLNTNGLWDNVVLMDKGCHHNGDRRRVTPFDLTSDLHDCLARLKTDHIDIFTFHRDDPSMPFEPVIEQMNRHIREGKISAFGASNWHVDRIRAANEYAAANGLAGLCCASLQYSLAEMYEEPWAESYTITGQAAQTDRNWFIETQMPMLNWSSLAGGFLSGDVTRTDADNPDKAQSIPIRCYGGEENWRRLDRTRELADKKGLSVPQIALAWLLNGPVNCFPLMAAFTPEQAKQNAAAVDVELSAEEVAWLNLE